jgi:hypothetical protein
LDAATEKARNGDLRSEDEALASREDDERDDRQEGFAIRII